MTFGYVLKKLCMRIMFRNIILRHAYQQLGPQETTKLEGKLLIGLTA